MENSRMEKHPRGSSPSASAAGQESSKRRKEDPETVEASGIRIVRMNTEKTRSAGGTEREYTVYFDLSSAPSVVWRNIFQAEWKAMHPEAPGMWDRVNFNNRFLAIRSSLDEIAELYLPLLKKAVAECNLSFARFNGEAEMVLAKREGAWKEERALVERVADSLKFGDGR